MIADVLRDQVNRFAGEIQAVLGQTVCQHVHIKAVSWTADDGARVFSVGHLIDKFLTPKRLPLVVTNKTPKLWLDVSFQMILDDEREWLTVRKSFFGVFESADAKDSVFHYDYERDKADNYPDAHLQVAGQDAVLARLLPGKAMEKLHFPVGGKRFRPCLEDMIEFMIRELRVDRREGYQAVLDASRARFQENQLRAAMRRNPDLVMEYAKKLGEETARA